MRRSEICFLYRALPFAVLGWLRNHRSFSNLEVLNTSAGFLSLPLRNQQRDLVACRCNKEARLPQNVLGYRLSAGETNSTRAGYILWGARQGSAAARRGA